MNKYFFLLLLFFPMFSKGQTFTNITNGPVPDNNSLVCFPVTVSGLPAVIDTSFGIISCCIDISHTYDSDLRIYLKGPNNLMIDLSSTNGGGSDNYSGTCFKMDGLSGPVINGSAPFIGTYIPETSLNLFNTGINPNGDWFLCVIDEVPNDSGTVNSFSITFGNNPPSDPNVPTGICSTTDASGCACPVAGATDCDLLPDMTSSALEIQNGYYEYPGYIDMSNATPNIGYGPLEIRGNGQCFCDTLAVPCNISMCPDSSSPTELITQRIYHKNTNGAMTFYDRPGGSMTYHPSHGHIHVDDWASYTLRVSTGDPDPRNWPIVGIGTKTSYCLINLGDCDSGAGICLDTNGVQYNSSNLPNYGLGIVSGCGTEQGIFVGSYDVYSAGLDGQRIYIPGICNDDYFIVSITDPDDHFKEMNENNNWVSVPVTLTGQPGITPAAAFTYSTSGMSAGFYNYATGINTYHWDFGDGTVDSSGQVVAHTYTTTGTFVVVLTIDNGTCKATSAQVITVSGNVGVETKELLLSDISIAPNPSQTGQTISFRILKKTRVNLAVFDMLGNQVSLLSDSWLDAGKHNFQVNRGEFAPGIYTVKITTGQTTKAGRLVVLK